MVMLAPLAPALPVAQAAQVSLLAPPELDFDLTITKGACGLGHVLRRGTSVPTKVCACAHVRSCVRM